MSTQLETINMLEQVNPGDFLVSNSLNFQEHYVVKRQDFFDRYTYCGIKEEDGLTYYKPKAVARNALQIVEGSFAYNYFFKLNSGNPRKYAHHRTFQQEEAFTHFADSEEIQRVIKDTDVNAITLTPFLIKFIKNQGGVKTYVSARNDKPLAYLITSWGDTQPVYEGDWLIVLENECYIVAKLEFKTTYRVL